MDLKAVIQESPCLWYSYSISLKERQEYERILKDTELRTIGMSSFFLCLLFFLLSLDITTETTWKTTQ